MIKRWGNKKSLPLFVFFAIHETVSYFCIYKPSNPDYQLWNNINLKFVPTLWKVALPHRQEEQIGWNYAPEYQKGVLPHPTEISSLSLMRQLIEVSQGMSVTFHRAFDVCRNPQEALEQIIELGCNRILTSGAQATAEQGIPLLKKLQQQADGRIILLAGCGVNENNIAHIAMETGIREFHFSARETIESKMLHRNGTVSMGGTVNIEEYRRPITTAERVKKTIKALTGPIKN